MNAIQLNNLGDTNDLQGAGVANENKLALTIDQVKREVFSEYQSALGANDQLLRLAIIEADALAHQTEYPHLVFPMLASEKAQSAARWQHHQQFRLRGEYALAA
jgi:hypothetical protein